MTRQVRKVAVLGAGTMGAAIAAHAASLEATPPAKAWRLLDRYATYLIRHESDRIWTQATGHRTPEGALGTFPEPPGKADPTVDDSLLEGLEDE